MEIVDREATLHARQADLQRQAARGTPQSPDLREVRDELKNLAAERQTLLAQVRQAETTLRAEQGRLDRNRAALTAQRGRRALPKVTKAEKQVRVKLAALASERAWLDGTVHRDREQAEMDNAIWNSAHDPETFGSDDW
jgi:predicted  nucleic acid-binding Zn-ribbon protein